MAPCAYGCRKRVAYAGNACKECATAHGLASGDLTGRLKAANAESSARPPNSRCASHGASLVVLSCSTGFVLTDAMPPPPPPSRRRGKTRERSGKAEERQAQCEHVRACAVLSLAFLAS